MIEYTMDYIDGKFRKW